MLGVPQPRFGTRSLDVLGPSARPWCGRRLAPGSRASAGPRRAVRCGATARVKLAICAPSPTPLHHFGRTWAPNATTAWVKVRRCLRPAARSSAGTHQCAPTLASGTSAWPRNRVRCLA